MRRLFLFALVATMFAACTTDVTQDVAIDIPTPETLTVSFEEDSRIQLQNGKTVWTKGDLVSVFYLSNANQQWQYQGETGERTGTLKRVMNTEATQELSSVVVVYPYNEGYYINPKTCNVKAWLPATQTYLKDSYGLDGNIMVSQSEYNQFSLKNVCGWLKIQLTGNGEKVQSIKLKGNNGEQVAGEIYINSADATSTLASEMGGADDGENSAGGNLVFDDTILTEVVLNCGEGVTLSSEATAFYIALPPQTFESGVTVEIRDINGYLMTKSTNKEIIINRNAIQPMAEFAFNGVFNNNEIYYIATHILNPREGDWGANIVSHVWNEGTGEGVITFDGDVVEIVDYAFVGGQTTAWLKSITIPSSVKVIGERAFAGLNITQGVFERIEFAKNSKLEKIKDGAFSLNPALKSIYLPSSVTDVGDGICFGCGALEGVYLDNDNYFTWLSGVLTKYLDSNTLQIVVFPAVFNMHTPDNTMAGATHIGYGAISMCNLKSLHWLWFESIDSYNFANCDGLTTIYLDRVETIGDYVLYMCDELRSIDLPVAKEIGSDCFADNSSLNSISLGSDELKTINRMGSNCPVLNTIKIPAGVTSITSSFNSCPAINEIYVRAIVPPVLTESFDSVTTSTIYVPAESVYSYKSADGWSKYADNIVGYDFEKGEVVQVQSNNEIWYTSSDGAEVTPQTSDVFGANIVSNTYNAEKECWVITFDADVTSIGEYAFRYCSSLTSVTIPDSVTEIGHRAFADCRSLTSVTIPDSVNEIGSGVFQNCISLTSVTIPDGVTWIGSVAFNECHSLKSVTIPDSVTSIGSEAFNYCPSLKSITIPDSVTEIGSGAFAGCSSLTEVNCKPTTPPTGGNWMFDSNASGRKIYVPTASVSAYKAKQYWSDYADYIVGYDF